MYGVCVLCTPFSVIFYVAKVYSPPQKKIISSLSEKNKNFGLNFPTWFDQRFQLQNLVDHMFGHYV